ncbi:MAG: AEC family transporter [Lachnospirales bacterium]
MDTFLFSLNAVAPIILVILLGYLINKIGLLDDDFFVKANKFVFNVALPIYLFYCVYNIESFSDIDWKLVIYAALSIVFVFFIASVFFIIYTKDSGKRGALIQCAFRSNYAIIGIPLAKAMGGDSTVSVAAIISAIGIPTFNILAVITLSIFSYDNSGKKISPFEIFKSICKNPLIRGVLSAIVVLIIRNFVDFRIKDDIPFLYDAIEQVGRIASPLALIVLGGRFQVSAVKELASDISLGVLWRLMITPFIGLMGAILLTKYGILSINSTSYPALIAFYGSPVAVSSAIMAEAMNSHGELSRQLVMWTNCVSVITIFVTIIIFKNLGFL